MGKPHCPGFAPTRFQTDRIPSLLSRENERASGKALSKGGRPRYRTFLRTDESGRLSRPNAACSYPHLVTKPCVVSFRSESWMPGHEIRKAFDLVRRLHDTHVCSRRSDPSESARYGEDEVASRDHEDRRDKEREAEHRTPSQAAFRQRPIDRRLLTFPGLDDGVRKVEIFFQRETSGADLLSSADQTHEVFLIEHFGL
jgi:hypothetical protein